MRPDVHSPSASQLFFGRPYRRYYYDPYFYAYDPFYNPFFYDPYYYAPVYRQPFYLPAVLQLSLPESPERRRLVPGAEQCLHAVPVPGHRRRIPFFGTETWFARR